MQRKRNFLLFISCIFLIFLARLFFLQIIKGDFYYKKSENNRIQLIKNIAPRGRIYDCKGRLLADSRPSFCASLIPWLAGDKIDQSLEHLNTICNINVEEVKKKIKKQKFRPFQPILLAQDLSPVIVSKILEHGDEFPGVVIETVPLRYYPNQSLCSHILGYVGEISDIDLEKLKDQGYEQGDRIGQAGIERYYEPFLKGINGGTEIEIDVRGKPANPPRVLDQREPTIGNDIILTIDKEIQKFCESALFGKRGAIVVSDPSNGDILAMASSPDFDPNMFTRSISLKEWQRISNNPGHPMLNRAVQATYPPGSAFKIVVGTAALEENKIDPEESFYCEGVQKAGTRVYKCWKSGGHGWVNFIRGIAESCDIYFYNLGVRLGPEIIGKYARLFGFGVPSGIDINGEKAGVIPDPEWKKNTKKERWFLGDTFNFSIGQGYVLVTPLQMVNAMNVLFNGGVLYKPRIVKEILFRGGEKKKIAPQITRQITLKASTLNTIKTALRSVVTKGTGILSNVPGVEVMGKTGTAQNPNGKDHAWFVCFAQPQAEDLSGRPLTMVVFIENGGGGSDVACPIANKILRSIYYKPLPVQTAADTETIESTITIPVEE